MGKQLKEKKDIVVGLDIGTTKVSVVVGELKDGKISIIGLGVYPSKGLRKGVIVNIDTTVESISKATEEAKYMAGVDFSSAVVGIGGSHIKGDNSNGVIAIKGKEVKEEDVTRVIEAAGAVAIPMDREILHIIPQEFVVDKQDGIKNPIGMYGIRLEAKVHIITGSVTASQNLLKCTRRAGIEVSQIVLQQLASSEAVLTPEEMELGVALVDIGGGTSDIAVYVNNSIRFTSILPFGGNHITNDIAIVLRTPSEHAERLKKEHGCASSSLVSKDEYVEVPGVGGREPRKIQRKLLADIIEARVEEILEFIKTELIKSGLYDLLGSGVVLTGGTSLLPGIQEVAERIFELPARIGRPVGVSGLSDIVNSPSYSVPVGLVICGFGMGKIVNLQKRPFSKEPKFLKKIKKWMDELF